MATTLTCEVQATQKDHAVDAGRVVVKASFVRRLRLLLVVEEEVVPVRKPAFGPPHELDRRQGRTSGRIGYKVRVPVNEIGYPALCST